MTPAIKLLQKNKIAHQVHAYHHQPGSKAYGEEAAHALQQDPARVFKTLLVNCGGSPAKLAVAVVPVSGQLNLKKMAKALGVKKVEMANPAEAERVTGYMVGGISPLGQKKSLPTVLDRSAQDFPTLFASAGQRGLEIELAPADLLALCRGLLADIAG